MKTKNIQESVKFAENPINSLVDKLHGKMATTETDVLNAIGTDETLDKRSKVTAMFNGLALFAAEQEKVDLAEKIEARKNKNLLRVGKRFN